LEVGEDTSDSRLLETELGGLVFRRRRRRRGREKLWWVLWWRRRRRRREGAYSSFL